MQDTPVTDGLPVVLVVVVGLREGRRPDVGGPVDVTMLEVAGSRPRDRFVSVRRKDPTVSDREGYIFIREKKTL